jgi:hypothetical protein
MENDRLCNAQEAEWREVNRRAPNGEQITLVACRAMMQKPPVVFLKCWERNKAVPRATSGRQMKAR